MRAVLLCLPLLLWLAGMSGTAAKRGRPVHPCWDEIDRPVQLRPPPNGVCKHCNLNVPNVVLLADTHLVYTCNGISAERREWYR